MPEESGTTPATPAPLSDAEKSLIQTRWRDAINPEFGTHQSTADYKTLDDLTKSYINQQKLVGAEKLPKPTKKWKKAEWESFNKQIGMPDKPEEYDLKSEKLPKDYKVNPDDEKWFRETARNELNLSTYQAKVLWEKLHGRNIEKFGKNKEQYQQSVQEGFTKLKEEWGPNYDNIVKQTAEGIKRMDEDGRFMKFMKTKGLDQEPEMLRFAAKVAKMTREDKIDPKNEKSTNTLSASEAKAQLAKMFSEATKAREKGEKHPLFDKKDPQHSDLVKKVERLSEIAGPAKRGRK
jgi:hypothetical protein